MILRKEGGALLQFKKDTNQEGRAVRATNGQAANMLCLPTVMLLEL